MITVERTGGGLCGETIVKHGVKNLVFAPNADVSMTAHGILIIERGLATSRTTYLLEPNPGQDVLIRAAHALRIHEEDYNRTVKIHDYPAVAGQTYAVLKNQNYVEVVSGPNGTSTAPGKIGVSSVKAIVAELSLIPAPPPVMVQNILSIWTPLKKALRSP